MVDQPNEASDGPFDIKYNRRVFSRWDTALTSDQSGVSRLRSQS